MLVKSMPEFKHPWSRVKFKHPWSRVSNTDRHFYGRRKSVFDGETVASGAKHPGTKLSVLQSAAGFYIGYLSEDGFPYSRESGYFATAEEAKESLSNGSFIRSNP